MQSSNKGSGTSFKETPCVIALDQSYKRTGISVCVRGKVKKVYSIELQKIKGIGPRKGNFGGKTLKRKAVSELLDKVINMCLSKFEPNEVTVLVERIRTLTASGEVRPNVMKAHAALIATIVDKAVEYGIRTYSVDTRCWKTAILGSSSPIFEPIEGVTNPQKFGSVRKAIKLGFKENLSVYSVKTGEFKEYNDDMADAICMSLYLFKGKPYKIKLEE